MSEKKIYPKWKVKIVGNKVVFDDRPSFDRHLVPMEGQEKYLIIKDRSKDRSRQEEKYYHAVVVRLIGEAMDISDQEAHEFLKKMFLTVEERTAKGLRYVRVKSTTELNDKEYRSYWGKCRDWAALPTEDDGLSIDSGLELYIPEPNEVDYSDA